MKRPLIYCGIIFGITLIAYWFSFTQLLKSETYFFFWHVNDVAHIEWYQLFLTPGGFAQGDTWLFRPLIYLIDSLRQLWFGTNYIYWHIFGFCAHILASLALFRLLWEFKPNVLALLVTLCFSVSSVSIGAVLYEDINGYQLFVALMLTGFYYAYQYLQMNKKRDLVFCAISLFVASFLYEVGLVVIIAVGIYLVLSHKVKSAFIFYSIIPVYLFIYIWSNLSNPMAAIEGSRILNFQNILYGLNNTFTIMVRWVCEIILPAAFYLKPLPQIRYQPVVSGDEINIPIIVLNLVALAFVAYAIISAKNKSNKLLYIFGGLSIVYILIIAIMRSSILGEGYITSTNFDTYMLLAMVFPLVYLLIRNTPDKLVRYACIGLIIFVSINGFKAFKANYELSQLEIPAKQYLAQVDNFVSQHQSESDFTFHVVANDKLENDLTLSFLYQDKLTDFTVPQIVYYRYWAENPKYNLIYINNKLVLQ